MQYSQATCPLVKSPAPPATLADVILFPVIDDERRRVIPRAAVVANVEVPRGADAVTSETENAY